jgi:hypothetical protein
MPTGPTVRAAIDEYVSHSLTPEQFAAVRDFARSAVAAIEPPTPHAAKSFMRDICQLCAWCLDVGIDLSIDAVFDQDTVERYILTLGDRSAAVQRTYSSGVRRAARALAPQLQRPIPKRHARSASKAPYSRSEIDEFLLLAQAQATRRQAVRLASLICLGAGAGLQPGEYQLVEADADIYARAGTTYVDVRGRCPRRVPVLEPLGARLLMLSVLSPDHYVLGGEAWSNRRNVVENLYRGIKGGDHLPRLEIGRLRATWFARQLEALGVDALLAGAGIRTTNALFDLTRRMPTPSSERISRFLRGSL